MDIPLVLSERARRGEGARGFRLNYGIPLWYRLAMVGIAGLLVAALTVSGGSTGILGYLLIGISVFAALYEEAWVFDDGNRKLEHRFGLMFFSRKLSLPFDDIAVFRIEGFVRGSLPGSASEAADNEKALAASRPRESGSSEKESIADGVKRKMPIYKKAYVRLICENADGNALVLNTLPANRGGTLRTTGARIAAYCGKQFREG